MGLIDRNGLYIEVSLILTFILLNLLSNLSVNRPRDQRRVIYCMIDVSTHTTHNTKKH
jgi:hypothetical protein